MRDQVPNLWRGVYASCVACSEPCQHVITFSLGRRVLYLVHAASGIRHMLTYKRDDWFLQQGGPPLFSHPPDAPLLPPSRRLGAIVSLGSPTHATCNARVKALFPRGRQVSCVWLSQSGLRPAVVPAKWSPQCKAPRSRHASALHYARQHSQELALAKVHIHVDVDVHVHVHVHVQWSEREGTKRGGGRVERVG